MGGGGGGTGGVVVMLGSSWRHKRLSVGVEEAQGGGRGCSMGP